MNQINFEQDKTEAINQTNDVKSLSEQVLKLRNLEDQIKNTEDNLKKLKKDADLLSGEIIPTMMTEMNSIGYDWKDFDMSSFSYLINQNRCYFIRWIIC